VKLHLIAIAGVFHQNGHITAGRGNSNTLPDIEVLCGTTWGLLHDVPPLRLYCVLSRKVDFDSVAKVRHQEEVASPWRRTEQQSLKKYWNEQMKQFSINGSICTGKRRGEDVYLQIYGYHKALLRVV
jgi:hypothetical protein